MIRLLRANFVRIFRSWYFQLGAAVFVIINFTVPFSYYRDIMKYPEEYGWNVANFDRSQLSSDELKFVFGDFSYEAYMFATGLIMLFILPIIIGLFIGTDYSDGTIRNKLVVGHKRINVYLANLITVVSASEMIYLAGLAVSYITGLICFNESVLSASELFLFILVGMFITASWAAVCTAFSMIFHSKSGAVVIALLFSCVMSIVSSEILTALEMPQYYDENLYMDEVSGQDYELPYSPEDMTEDELMEFGINPDDVDNIISLKHEIHDVPQGLKRKVFQLVREASPGCQYEDLAAWNDKYNGKTIFWSSVIILLTTSAGIFIFIKQNLK